MIQELDSVVLTRDIPEKGLVSGDVGAVVHVYSAGSAYEVEFVNGTGKTVALLTLQPSDIRLQDEEDVLHIRRRSMPIPA